MTREEEAAVLLGEARETITDLSAGHDVLIARIDAWLAGRREATPRMENNDHGYCDDCEFNAIRNGGAAYHCAKHPLKPAAAPEAADAPAVGSRWTDGGSVAWTCVRHRAEGVTFRSEFGELDLTLPEFRAEGWRPVVEPAPLVVRDDGVTLRAKGED